MTLLVAGCFHLPALYTDEPLGEPIPPGGYEPKDWDGLWICTGGGIHRVQAIDPTTEGPTIIKDWRNCDPTSSTKDGEDIGRVDIRKVRVHGNWFFQECEGRLITGEPCRYEWGDVAARVGETVFLFEADEARIRQLLDQGKVPGRIEYVMDFPAYVGQPNYSATYQWQRVVLHSLRAEHYDVLLQLEDGAFKATILQCTRLPAELDPCKAEQESGGSAGHPEKR
jgi:hypothetical protein